MKNDSYSEVKATAPEIEGFDRAMQVLEGSHEILRFPVPVTQVNPREIAIPVLPVDYVMFGDAFEHMVKEQLGQADGEEFIRGMVKLVSRKLMIAQIR